jgi:ferredoxin-NADP reductase
MLLTNEVRMEKYIVKIIKTEYITHDVKRFVVEKPSGYKFIPGQATDLAINDPAWIKEERPFTFTGLNHWDNLEFIIKIYRDHNGVTKQLEKLKPGDSFVIGDPWGAITYKGKGFFIAGGAGITPFIAILRQLHYEKKIEGNSLIFSNKYADDIILDDELTTMLSTNYYKLLTRQQVIGFLDRRINEALLIKIIKDFDQYFYVCGPDSFVADISEKLEVLGAKTETVVTEKAETT